MGAEASVGVLSGFLDYLRILAEAKAVPRKLLSKCEKQHATDSWLQSMLAVPEISRTVRPFKSIRMPREKALP